jgi:hypothetical protein
VTPKGVRPEDRHDRHDRHGQADTEHHAVAASSRYTPKATNRQLVPPHWIPVIMLVLLIGGGLMIMARYLFFTESNWPTLVGLAAILGGLYTATKWR